MNRLSCIGSPCSFLSIAMAVICLALTSIASAEDATAPDGKPVAKRLLKNGDMEKWEKSPSTWKQGAAIPGVRYAWDRKVGHNSKASLCLHKTANRYFPIAQWHQMLPNSGQTSKLKVTAWVKAEKAAKGIIDVQFADEKVKRSHQWVAYIGARKAGDPPVSHDWKKYSGVVEIPSGTKHIAVALQIYGPGRLWFDDVRAEFVSNETPKTDALSTKPAP